MSEELSDYATKLGLQAKLRYLDKLNGLSSLNYTFPDPYIIPLSEWCNDIASWPQVSFGDIYMYLKCHSNNVYDEVALKNYKSLKAYEYVTSGKVQSIRAFRGSNSNFSILSAEVQRSHCLSEGNHKPWVIVGSNGTVHTAHCTCMAGLGEACSHVAAILFKIEMTYSVYSNTVSPTDSACKWNHSFASKKVENEQIKNIDLSKTHWPVHAKRKFNCLPIPDLPSYSEAEIQSLKRLCPNAVCMRSYNSSSSTESVSSDDYETDMPPTIIEAVSLASEKKLIIKSYLKTCFTIENCKILYEKTKDQSSCPLWHEHRRGRFTSSNFKTIITRKKWDLNFINRLMKSNTNISTPSMTWGKNHESEAMKAYEERMVCQHVNFHVEKCGLMINPTMPHLGASPDGISKCDCCGTGLIEIKYPYKGKEKPINEIKFENAQFYLKSDGSLKENHMYFYQIQGQMAIAGLRHCDFVVWTEVDMAVQRIQFQEDFWMDNMQFLEESFYKHMIPILLNV